MQIDILTMFPKMFSGPLTESILARAQKKGIIKIKIHDLKKWGLGSYKKVDDKPYGGGSGMVMRIDIIDKALKSVTKGKKPYVILLSAKGKTFSQESFSKGLAKLKSPSSILPLIKGEVGGGNKFLEYPHYTRPEIYQGKKVPSVLLSGHHAKIKEWRRKHTRSKK